MDVILALILSARGDKHFSGNRQLFRRTMWVLAEIISPRINKERGASQAQNTDRKLIKKVTTVNADTIHKARINPLDTPKRKR